MSALPLFLLSSEASESLVSYNLTSSLTNVSTTAVESGNTRRSFMNSFTNTLESDRRKVLDALSDQPTSTSTTSLASAEDSTPSMSNKVTSEATNASSDISEQTEAISSSIMASIGSIISSIFGLKQSDDTSLSTAGSTTSTSSYTKAIGGNIAQAAPAKDSPSSTASYGLTMPTIDTNIAATADKSRVSATTDSIAVATTAAKTTTLQDAVAQSASNGAASATNDTGYAIVPITANGVQGVAILPTGNSSLSSLISSLTTSAAAPATNAAAAAVLPTTITSPDSAAATTPAQSNPVDSGNINGNLAAPAMPNNTTDSLVTTTAANTLSTPSVDANNFDNGSQHTINKTPLGSGSLADGEAEALESAADNVDGVRVDGALGSRITINLGSSTTPTAGSIRIVSS